jgi:RND family efflux transporter MFP subunit
VKKGDLIQEVSATGRVKSAEDVDLAFEKSGRVAGVLAKVGDKVYTGQTIVRLENGDIVANLNSAQANLSAETARLEELKKGARTEDIQAKQSELNKAQQDLDNYYSGIPDILNDAYVKADDAVRKQTDGIFNYPEEISPKLTFQISSVQIQSDAEAGRAAASRELNSWKTELSQINSASHGDLTQAMEKTKPHLAVIRDFLSKAMDATNNVVTNSVSYSQTTNSTYKYNINLGRTNINTALSNINTREQVISSQIFAVKKIQDELNLKLAGSTPEEIKIQEAKVEVAQASVLNANAQLLKTIIRAPINGVITKQEAKVGEIVSPNATIVSVISEAKFQTESNVPEADIAKIKVGNLADITLDAYGSDVIFGAKVVKIDPAETIIEGVPTYKTTFIFTGNDDRIKSGMTANIEITTAERKNVIIIPRRAVIKKDGGEFVQIKKGENIAPEELKVKTGVQGSDGFVEILSGLKEGDQIVSF